jgi:outer membrane biosynthesis protein TonB
MRAPAGMPPSGNTKYVAIFAVLVVLTGALVAAKTCGGGNAPVAGPVKPASTFDAAPISHNEDTLPPPPIPDEPAPSASATATRATAAFDPCSVKTCTGESTSELETQIGFRAKAARRCYENALAQDAELKGHVSLKVKIGSNGAVCAATVASNDMGTDSVANCAAQTFRASRSFPPPKGNCVEATVPLNFVKGH